MCLPRTEDCEQSAQTSFEHRTFRCGSRLRPIRWRKTSKEKTTPVRRKAKPMNILLTVHQFLPDYSAGTEVLTFETAKELRRSGHNVHIFTGYPAREHRNDDERFDHYEVEGLPVERFHHSYVPMGGQENTTEAEYDNHLFATYFREFLKRQDFDVVHFFHLGRLSASAVEVCYQAAIRMVLTPTDFWFVCPTNQLRLPDGSMCKGP